MILSIYLVITALILSISGFGKVTTGKVEGYFDVALGIWSFFILMLHLNPMPYLWLIMILYLITFIINIMNKNHLAIIITGFLLLYAYFLIKYL